ncbi:MAG: dienelactone hydrolase family protein [Bryobacteraceae bacterium]
MTRREWLALGACLPACAQTVDEDIRRLAASAPLSMQFGGGSAEECGAWQRAFRAKLDSLLGLYRPPERWSAVRERVVDCGDYRREELLLRAGGERDVPVHLLLPKASGRRPGVLALHGHGEYGHDSVAGLDHTPERASQIQSAHYDYGRQLARRGYVVAAPCFTPFGRRLGNRAAYRNEDPCAVTFVRMQLLGRLLLAENLRDALWTLEMLASHESVDASRLGCVGLSLGGRMAMMVSAVAPRVRAAVISGALNVMQERIQGRYSCGAQVIPGLLRFGDVPEVASLIAPRPCLWEVGRQDSLMVKDRLEPALARMRRAWSAFGAADQLRVDSFEGGHQWNGVEAYPLLARVLRP